MRSLDAMDGFRPSPRRRRLSRPLLLRAAVATTLLCASPCWMGGVSGFSAGGGLGALSRRRILTDPSVAVASRTAVKFGSAMDASAATTVLLAKKPTNGAEDETPTDDDRILGLKKTPGTLLVLPFVAIFGLDLILNILAVTRRSLSVLFTGEYTPWTPWQ